MTSLYASLTNVESGIGLLLLVNETKEF